jgi:hypothetical protein
MRYARPKLNRTIIDEVYTHLAQSYLPWHQSTACASTPPSLASVFAQGQLLVAGGAARPLAYAKRYHHVEHKDERRERGDVLTSFLGDELISGAEIMDYGEQKNDFIMFY